MATSQYSNFVLIYLTGQHGAPTICSGLKVDYTTLFGKTEKMTKYKNEYHTKLQRCDYLEYVAMQVIFYLYTDQKSVGISLPKYNVEEQYY